jgi:hypothetical protein
MPPYLAQACLKQYAMCQIVMFMMMIGNLCKLNATLQ